MYNSLYNLVVDLNLASQQSKKRWYGKLNFRTELCEDVDTKTYTKCNDNIIDSKVGTDVNKYSGQEEEKETG